jgi:hypothetical protein
MPAEVGLVNGLVGIVKVYSRYSLHLTAKDGTEARITLQTEIYTPGLRNMVTEVNSASLITSLINRINITIFC